VGDVKDWIQIIEIEILPAASHATVHTFCISANHFESSGLLNLLFAGILADVM
jgi:hypothetical protein